MCDAISRYLGVSQESFGYEQSIVHSDITQATFNDHLRMKVKFTLTHDSKDFPYLAAKASLMSPKSISDLETMMRMSVLSLVPAKREMNLLSSLLCSFCCKFSCRTEMASSTNLIQPWNREASQRRNRPSI